MHFPFFNNKKSLIDASVFGSMTDWHCHILPGVDDGIATMHEALDVLQYYEQIGINDVWLTPHIIEDIPNTTESLRRRFEELKNNYHGSITLRLAAENMVDSLFLERLKTNDVLPVGDKADHLLIEFSYVQPPTQLYNIIDNIHDRGYMPILAHPERYAYMSVEDIEALRCRGCKLQMNIPSLTGAYGSHVKEKAETMLSKSIYDICGSDLHSLSHFQRTISQKSVKNETIKALSALMHSDL